MKKNILEEALRDQIRKIIIEEVIKEELGPAAAAGVGELGVEKDEKPSWWQRLFGKKRPKKAAAKAAPAMAAPPAKAPPAKAAPAKAPPPAKAAPPAKKAPAKKARKKKSRYRDIDYVQAVSDIANKYGEGISIFEDPSTGTFRDLERETYDKKLKKSVKKLQKKLGFKGRLVDGWFGPKTACVLKKRLKPNIQTDCFKKEWVMKLANNLREEERANAKKGASKPKPKKAKASFNAYRSRLMHWRKAITKIKNDAKFKAIDITDNAYQEQLFAIRRRLKALKKQLEADTNFKNPEDQELIGMTGHEIERINDMLAKSDMLGESKFSNDKELQNLMESFKKFTRND